MAGYNMKVSAVFLTTLAVVAGNSQASEMQIGCPTARSIDSFCWADRLKTRTVADQASANTDNGYQVVGEYRFLRYFSVEARKGSLGEYRSEVGFEPITSEFAAYTGNAVGTLPFGESGLAMTGQLGAGLLSHQMDSTFADEHDEDKRAVGTAGLGIRYASNSALTLTAGYDTYLFQLDSKRPGRGGDQMISMAQFGLQYTF